MSSWYRFCCRCPGCGGGEPTNWYHAEESCCSTVGWLYINGECNIKCDECYGKKDKKPSFVLGWEFKCSRHQGEYKKADEMYVCAAIGYICTNNNIPKETRQQMINIVNNYNY
jgi:hypothetical protein